MEIALPELNGGTMWLLCGERRCDIEVVTYIKVASMSEVPALESQSAQSCNISHTIRRVTKFLFPRRLFGDFRHPAASTAQILPLRMSVAQEDGKIRPYRCKFDLTGKKDLTIAACLLRPVGTKLQGVLPTTEARNIHLPPATGE